MITIYFIGQCQQENRVISYPHNIRRDDQVFTWQNCQLRCQNEISCEGWSWNKGSKQCFLKSKLDTLAHNSAFISGPKKCTPSITVTSANTRLPYMDLYGCRIPWWAKIFFSSRKRRHAENKIKEYIELYIRQQNEMFKAPLEYSPFPKAFISYLVTDVHWSEQNVIIRTRAQFTTEVNGSNVTYVPTVKAKSGVSIFSVTLGLNENAKYFRMCRCFLGR